MALNCFRYLGFTTFDEVYRLSFHDYEVLMKAAALKEADLDYRCHMLAFLNTRAGLKKRAGKNKEKFAYPTFKKFYDREKAIDEVMNPKAKKDRFEGLKNFLRKEGKGREELFDRGNTVT